ncbi:MAG: 3-ketoacyl-ACP reductase [Planctomycetota bacterium]
MANHERRVALVTGGSRGIGLGISIALAQRGFDVVINGRRAEAELREPIARIEAEGAAVAYVQADVAAVEGHAAMLDAIRARFARLDCLVNNAGVAPQTRDDLLDATPESYDRVMRINLRGPYFLTQAAAKWMIEQKQHDATRRCSIINVSSVSATVASVNRGEYCISKAGIAMATMLWAARLGEVDIPVYEIRPGVIRTDMTDAVQEKYDRLFAEGLTVERRWGTPEDVGSAAAALADGAIPYATGQVMMVDGGLTLQRL